MIAPILVWLPALALGVPTVAFASQVLLGSARRTFERGERPSGLRVAVLVPAHDEARGIARTLEALAPELEPQDRILVVADNCGDDTAAIARGHGAQVLERRSELRGKGYALSAGIDALANDPPDFVVIVDADCEPGPGSIGQLIATSARCGRPAQADYTMALPQNANVAARISCFAFRVRNRLRPRGLHRLGLPCHLTGSGMAFPWRILRDAPSTAGHIAEDLLLGLELAARGTAPLFCPTAAVSSTLASSGQGRNTQRERWEHGHLSLWRSHLARLVATSVVRRDRELFSSALDLSVPPLSLHLLLLLSSQGLALAGLATGLGAGPLLLTSLELAATGGAVLLAWQQLGKDLLPASTVLDTLPYVLGKVPSYVRFGTGRAVSAWRRTERE